MKLSIITINYNNCEGLRKTIRSVLPQSFQDYEWIVIDGGSTDGSKELLEQNQESFTYWVSESDRGIYHAMNKGIEHAQGEYCQFLNSGDYFIDDDVLSKVFSCELVDVNYGDQWCMKDGEVVEKRTYPEQIHLPYLFAAPLGHQASFFRTALVREHLYKEQYTISADRAFFLELYVAGARFKHLSIPIVYFDTDGIGSNEKTKAERRKQLFQIKREFFSDQVVKDIEQLISKSHEYDFVMRIRPLKIVYLFFKKLQLLKYKWL